MPSMADMSSPQGEYWANQPPKGGSQPLEGYARLGTEIENISIDFRE